MLRWRMIDDSCGLNLRIKCQSVADWIHSVKLKKEHLFHWKYLCSSIQRKLALSLLEFQHAFVGYIIIMFVAVFIAAKLLFSTPAFVFRLYVIIWQNVSADCCLLSRRLIILAAYLRRRGTKTPRNRGAACVRHLHSPNSGTWVLAWSSNWMRQKLNANPKTGGWCTRKHHNTLWNLDSSERDGRILALYKSATHFHHY